MKLSVQLTRDRDGKYNVAVDSILDNLTEISVDGLVEAIAIFEAMVKLVIRIKALTCLQEED